MTSEAAKATLLRLVAIDLLQKLLVAVPGRVQLCVLQSGTNVVIESLDGPYKFSLLEAVGTRRPAYFGASGKVLMAHTDAEIRVHLLPEELIKFTEKSIPSRAEFDLELEPIRRRGFAISNEETVKWVRGIAVPVFAPDESFLAAISLGLPVEEFPDAKIQSIARRMNSISAKITDALALNSSWE
jgi:DNA-binding IclR family transcriptional regulator